MVLLWLWLSEQQCKRSRDFLARWDLPDTTLTFGSVVGESGRDFATPHSRRKDVWGTSAEIPYWWRVATQNWVIGWRHFLANQVLGRHVICMEFPRLFLRRHFAGETSGGFANCRLFSQAKVFPLSSKTNISTFQHHLRGSGTTVL